MLELTKAEEEIMQVLWQIEKGFVKDILEHLPEPKPAYNTVSTVVRILEKKEAVSYKSFGKSHRYFPILKQEDYTKHSLNKLAKGYFNGSFKSMVSFFVNEQKISLTELDDLMNDLKNESHDE